MGATERWDQKQMKADNSMEGLDTFWGKDQIQALQGRSCQKPMGEAFIPQWTQTNDNDGLSFFAYPV